MLWWPVLSSFLPISSVVQQQQPLFTSDIPKLSSSQVMPPREVPLDVENYPVAPAELVLEQVHVFVRHGECSESQTGFMIPGLNTFPSQGNEHRSEYDLQVLLLRYLNSGRVSWSLRGKKTHQRFRNMCHTGRNFRAAVAATLHSNLENETLDVQRVVERRDGTFRDGDWYENISPQIITSTQLTTLQYARRTNWHRPKGSFLNPLFLNSFQHIEKMTYNYGQALRKLYIEKWAL
jgi:hypothetical protein